MKPTIVSTDTTAGETLSGPALAKLIGRLRFQEVAGLVNSRANKSDPDTVYDPAPHLPMGNSRPAQGYVVKRSSEVKLKPDEILDIPSQEARTLTPTEKMVGSGGAGSAAGEIMGRARGVAPFHSSGGSIGEFAGGLLRKAQTTPLVKGLGGLMYGHGPVVGGLLSAAGGYGVGKLAQRFGANPDVPWPLLAALLAGGAGAFVGGLNKSAGWKSDGAKSRQIENLMRQLNGHTSPSQLSSVRNRLENAPESLVNQICNSATGMVPSLAVAFIIKMLTGSNVAAVIGGITNQILTSRNSPQKSTSGLPVFRFDF